MVLKALVTGALGHTGSMLANLLADKGWHIVATDLDPTTRKEIMKKEGVFSDTFRYKSIDRPEIKFVAADLTDKKSLYSLFSENTKDYNVIFHPASLYDYFAEIDLLRKINVLGTKNLLEVMIEVYNNNIPRFIHWSTCGVYGEPEYEQDANGFPIPTDETAPFNPPNNYSISKTEQENLLHKITDQHPLKYTILRSAPIYGPFQIYGTFHIFYLIYTMGYSVLPLIFPRKYKLMMPLVHIQDLIEAALFVWDKPETVGQAYNVIGENITQESWLEFVYNELGVRYITIPIWWPIFGLISKILFHIAEKYEKKARQAGHRPKIDMPMAGYIIHQYFFTSKKLRELGFKFKFNDPCLGTRTTLRWYIDEGWLKSEK